MFYCAYIAIAICNLVAFQHNFVWLLLFTVVNMILMGLLTVLGLYIYEKIPYYGQKKKAKKKDFVDVSSDSESS